MSELSGLSTTMLLNILRVCTDSRVQRGRELEYVRVVREATEEALVSERMAPKPPPCGEPGAASHVWDEPCWYCWADPEDMEYHPCQHHAPCLLCESPEHAECEHTS